MQRQQFWSVPVGTRSITFVAIAIALIACANTRAAEPKDGNFKASDGVNIHYVTLGDSGPWVVLIHGFSDSAQRMWVSPGIAGELAKNHRVVVIDNRNHGKSDKPNPGGSGRWQDTLELMDLLKIEKAHIQGYSMGGGITLSLLTNHPERFITAGFGGSGIGEVDAELRSKAAALDAAKSNPEEAARESARWEVILRGNPRGGRGATARGGDTARGATPPAGATADAGKSAAPATTAAPAATGTPAPAATASTPAAEPAAGARGRGRGTGGAPRGPAIDLSKITFPVFGINGELDSPNAKTQRMARELKNFKAVVIPDKTHLTAIGVGGPWPEVFKASVVEFINANDPKP